MAATCKLTIKTKNLTSAHFIIGQMMQIAFDNGIWPLTPTVDENDDFYTVTLPITELDWGPYGQKEIENFHTDETLATFAREMLFPEKSKKSHNSLISALNDSGTTSVEISDEIVQVPKISIKSKNSSKNTGELKNYSGNVDLLSIDFQKAEIRASHGKKEFIFRIDGTLATNIEIVRRLKINADACHIGKGKNAHILDHKSSKSIIENIAQMLKKSID